MTRSRHILPARARWTAIDEQLLREFYPDWPTWMLARYFGRDEGPIYQKAHSLGLCKSAEFLATPASGRLRADSAARIGGATRFQHGQVAFNKGLRRPGYAPGRMRETQFKPGVRSGAAARNYVPIGTEKIVAKRNVLMRKTTDDPSIFPVKRWRPVHVIVWESVNGAVPRGHIVRFKSGKKTFVASEITIDRLELVSLAENMRSNSLHRYPKEVVHLIQLKGALNRKVHRRERQSAEEQP